MTKFDELPLIAQLAIGFVAAPFVIPLVLMVLPFYLIFLVVAAGVRSGNSGGGAQ